MYTPLWSKRLFRGAFLTTSGGSSRGDWLLAALRLSSCAVVVSAAAAAREFGAMVRKASAAPRFPGLWGDPNPIHLFPTPSRSSVHLPGPPVCDWILPLPAADTLGLALGPGARVRPAFARPPAGSGEPCGVENVLCPSCSLVEAGVGMLLTPSILPGPVWEQWPRDV